MVGKPPSSAHRRALDVCGHVVDTTEELLRVALPDEDATELFAWLRQLSFMKSGPFGVCPYDVVRDALDSDFRWRDPQRYKAMHRTVRRHLVERVRNAPEKEALRAAREFNHIVSRAQWMREFQGGRDEGAVHEEPMRPEDAPALIELTRKVEGEHNARVVAHWLKRQPEAFHVHRRCDTGQLLGFMAWLRIDGLDDETRAADPVTAEAWELVSAMTPRARASTSVWPGSWCTRRTITVPRGRGTWCACGSSSSCCAPSTAPGPVSSAPNRSSGHRS